jgi:sigma-B regulation protein RsbQ
LRTRERDFFERHGIETAGRGDHTIVLANGFGAPKESWRPLVPWLTTRGRVVQFDWATSPEHFEITRYGDVDGYAEDMLAVIERTAAAPCTLIGHSIAAMIGMVAAKRRPSFFRHIVMIAPTPRFVRDECYPAGFSPEEADAFLEELGNDYVAWVAAFEPAVDDHAEARIASDDIRASLKSLRPDIALTMARLLFSIDFRPCLDDYRTPTTIIQPTSSYPVAPVAAGRYLAKCWPEATLEIVEASGYLPHVTAPDKIRAVLARVLPDPP